MIGPAIAHALLGVATLCATVTGGDDPRVQAAAAAVAAQPGVVAAIVVEVATGRVLGRAGAVERSLPPGSTFKLVAALAAAERAPEALSQTVGCAGRALQAGQVVTCWRGPRAGGHGALALEEAVARSCNVWFGALGERVGARAIVDEARALGLGGEADGALPDGEAPGPLVADGVGVRTSAREQAELMRQIASGRRRDGRPLAATEPLARIREGMRRAVADTDGTGHAAWGRPAPAGKTGTSDLGGGSVGWFLAYAPADAPTVALAIARRDARGADVAALARPLLDAYFHGRFELPPSRGLPSSRPEGAASPRR